MGMMMIPGVMLNLFLSGLGGVHDNQFSCEAGCFIYLKNILFNRLLYESHTT